MVKDRLPFLLVTKDLLVLWHLPPLFQLAAQEITQRMLFPIFFCSELLSHICASIVSQKHVAAPEPIVTVHYSPHL